MVNMNGWRKAELCCGVACGLLGPLPFFVQSRTAPLELFRRSPEFLLEAVLMFLLPGLLVAVGSYLHGVRNKKAGLILLLLGGIFLVLMTLIHFFSGAVFYRYGTAGGVVVLLQGLFALLTMILVLLATVDEP